MAKRQTYFWSLIALAFIGVFFALYQPLQGVFLRLTDTLGAYAEARPVLGPVIFVGLAALSVLLGPASSGPLVPSAVAIWGKALTATYLVAGWLSGAIVTFFIGYTLGYSIVQHIVGEAKLKSWMEILEEEGTMFRLFLFRLLTPAETGYLFGVVRFPFWKYFLLTAIVEGTGALAAVYAGEAFFELDRARFFVLFVAYVLVATGVVLTVKVKRQRRLQKKAQQKD